MHKFNKKISFQNLRVICQRYKRIRKSDAISNLQRDPKLVLEQYDSHNDEENGNRVELSELEEKVFSILFFFRVHNIIVVHPASKGPVQLFLIFSCSLDCFGMFGKKKLKLDLIWPFGTVSPNRP